MMTAFETRTIEEVTETLIDYRGKTPPKAESGVRLVTAKVIKDGFIQEERSEYISEGIYASWMRRGYPQQCDIVLTTEAPLGEVAQLRTTEKIALAQRVILLRGDPNIIDQQFLFQAIRSPFVQAGLQQRATGTTVLGIKQSELRQVNIPYYPLPTQRKIAAILSAYDDLIENNLRRIKILEEMAQNLYREWFVKFRFPGHQNARFVDSPLGRIPEGWEVVTVEQIVERVPSGKKYDQKTVSAIGTVPVLDQGRSGIIGYHDDEPGILASEDAPIIVFANHTCYQRLVMFAFSAIQNVLPFVPSSEYPRNIYWLHYATKDLVTFNDYKGHWPEFMAKELVLPSANACHQFGGFVEPITRMIYKMEMRNETLRRTRDLLLPRLISGEVDVSELDIAVPEEGKA